MAPRQKRTRIVSCSSFDRWRTGVQPAKGRRQPWWPATTVAASVTPFAKVLQHAPAEASALPTVPCLAVQHGIFAPHPANALQVQQQHLPLGVEMRIAYHWAGGSDARMSTSRSSGSSKRCLHQLDGLRQRSSSYASRCFSAASLRVSRCCCCCSGPAIFSTDTAPSTDGDAASTTAATTAQRGGGRALRACLRSRRHRLTAGFRYHVTPTAMVATPAASASCVLQNVIS